MLSNITHFWCPLCDAIQPAFFEGFDNIDVSGQFVGGDIVCETCRLVIATAYRPESSSIKFDSHLANSVF
jgi:hypothetical protein